MNEGRRSTDKQGPIPQVIPQVDWVDGEPVIAREQVVRRSPVPSWLGAFLIAMAVFSVGYTFVEQQHRTEAFRQQRIEDEADDRRVEGLVEDLQVQQQRADVERERLRKLVIGLLAAGTNEEREELLRQFAEENAEEDRDNAAEDEADPPGQPSENDHGVTEDQGASPPDPHLGDPVALPRPNHLPRNLT